MNLKIPYTVFQVDIWFVMEEPSKRDYYADLGGLPESASAEDIKAAWFKLAKLHHPDKKAPGEPIDADEFRRVSLLYIIL